MPRSIDNVDLDAAVGHRSVFGHDGNTFLAFEIDIVHHPFLDDFITPKNAALPEHGIHEGGLPVVHMGNHGNITNGVYRLHIVTSSF